MLPILAVLPDFREGRSSNEPIDERIQQSAEGPGIDWSVLVEEARGEGFREGYQTATGMIDEICMRIVADVNEMAIAATDRRISEAARDLKRELRAGLKAELSGLAQHLHDILLPIASGWGLSTCAADVDRILLEVNSSDTLVRARVPARLADHWTSIVEAAGWTMEVQEGDEPQISVQIDQTLIDLRLGDLLNGVTSNGG
jgi:hypothetical protein